MNTQNSSQKVKFCRETATLIGETRKAISSITESAKSVATTAKMSATDRAYNALADISNAFEDALTGTAETLSELLEDLSKATYIGSAFIADTKKAITEVEDVMKSNSYEKISAERAGEETWNSSLESELTGIIQTYNKKRREYIDTLAENSQGIDDEEFKEVIKKLGATNENFTNSISVATTQLNSALDELGLRVTSDVSKMTTSAASLKIDEVTTKFDLVGEEEA